MSKFNVGDIITGLPDNGYRYTTDRAKMVVTGLKIEGFITVIVINHEKYNEDLLPPFNVEADKFILAEPEFEGN